MKDDSGFSNWETERMYAYAQDHIKKLPPTLAELVQALRSYEVDINKLGRKHFLLYLPDPINYWEVYARVAMWRLRIDAQPTESAHK